MVGVLPVLRWLYCWRWCSTQWKMRVLIILGFFVVEDGVTHSPGCFAGILIGCSEDEYHRGPTVDSNAAGIATRGCSLGWQRF